MRYSIDKSSKESSYIQLYKQMRDDIVSGVYKYGEKLPSKRIMASETGTSVITVEHAYGILCDEGYVNTRERSGYFVSYHTGDVVPVSDEEEAEIFKEPYSVQGEDTFPFSVFSKTMRNVITKYGERLLIKSENFGTIVLRSAICSYLARGKGMKVTPDRIIIGSGAEYLYSIIIKLLGQDVIYGIENPSYEKIYTMYTAGGAECELLKLGADGILSSCLRNTKAGVLHVTPFRSFPSGITASASKRQEYIDWAKKRNAIIIEDDFESEFTVSRKNEDTIFSLEPQNHVIYINTFTRTIAPSMRIGYMVLPENLSDYFKEKIKMYSCTVPVFEQYVIAEFLNNGDFERHINKVRRRRRQLMENNQKDI